MKAYCNILVQAFAWGSQYYQVWQQKPPDDRLGSDKKIPDFATFHFALGGRSGQCSRALRACNTASKSSSIAGGVLSLFSAASIFTAESQPIIRLRIPIPGSGLSSASQTVLQVP